LIQDTPWDTSAALFLAFFYAPDVNTVYVSQMLYEETLSGRLITSVKFIVIGLEKPKPYEYVLWLLTVLLAILVFVMELRRILGCPKRFTFEAERDHFSWWTGMFFLLPVLIVIGFSINSTRIANDANSILDLNNNLVITPKAVSKLFELWSLDHWRDLIKLAVLVVQNMLFVRYTLMYFPFVSFLSKMVTKIFKPLITTLFFLVLGFMVCGVFFFVMYCQNQLRFYNVPSVFMETVIVAQGGLADWQELWEQHSGLWTMVFFSGFVIMTLILQNVTLAVMLSHKKEMNLQENYSFHPFWALAAVGKTRKQEFNPSTIGWIFEETGGDPRQPEEKIEHDKDQKEGS